VRRPGVVPEVSDEHRKLVGIMRRQALAGWYTGTPETAAAHIARLVVPGVIEPELAVSLSFSRDRMHHAVGWWRNAEYEYCWHLSVACKVFEGGGQREWADVPFEHFPHDELRYWATAFYGKDIDKTWTEPGGTDPRLTSVEKRIHATMWHVRLFLHPEILNPQGEPFHPFIPEGEVYDLTRWIDGLTPEKVDR